MRLFPDFFFFLTLLVFSGASAVGESARRSRLVVAWFALIGQANMESLA